MSIVDELDSTEPKGKETAEGKKKRSHVLILIGVATLVLMYLMYKHSKSSKSATAVNPNAPSPYGSAYGGTALPYQSGSSSGYGGIANALQQMQSQFTASQTASNAANTASQSQLSAEMASLQAAFAAATASHVGGTSTGVNPPVSGPYPDLTGTLATVTQANSPINNISAGETIRYTNPITGAVSPY